MAPPIASPVLEHRDVEDNPLTPTRTMNPDQILALLLTTFIVVVVSGVLNDNDNNPNY